VGVALAAALRPAIHDRDVTTLDPTQYAQSLNKGGPPLTLDLRRSRAQNSDGPQLRRLLLVRGERPSCSSAAEKRDEIAPSHQAVPKAFGPTPCGRLDHNRIRTSGEGEIAQNRPQTRSSGRCPGWVTS